MHLRRTVRNVQSRIRTRLPLSSHLTLVNILCPALIIHTQLQDIAAEWPALLIRRTEPDMVPPEDLVSQISNFPPFST